MKHLSLWIFLSILFGGRMTSVAAEWQWSVQIPSMISQETEAHPQAFLWIPDDCGQVKAAIPQADAGSGRRLGVDYAYT